MTEPREQWNGSQVLEFFCRHLIALCINFRRRHVPEGVSETTFRAYAGTLICFRNSVSFLTAGHALREIDEAIASDQVEIESAVLADTFGWRRVSDHPIPFDVANALRFYIDNEDEGLDFGLIALRPYYVRLLAANGAVAVTEENWIHQTEVTFDGHLMLGLPREFVSDQLSPSGEGSVSPTMLRVQRLEPSPTNARVTTYQRFVGRIDAELPLQSIVGMSGGPIFGVSFAPPMRYWVVALQSSWLRSERLVFGCPVPVLASLVTSWLDALPGEMERGPLGDGDDGSV